MYKEESVSPIPLSTLPSELGIQATLLSQASTQNARAGVHPASKTSTHQSPAACNSPLKAGQTLEMGGQNCAQLVRWEDLPPAPVRPSHTQVLPLPLQCCYFTLIDNQALGQNLGQVQGPEWLINYRAWPQPAPAAQPLAGLPVLITLESWDKTGCTK